VLTAQVPHFAIAQKYLLDPQPLKRRIAHIPASRISCCDSAVRSPMLCLVRVSVSAQRPS